jgi:hypothetical protein
VQGKWAVGEKKKGLGNEENGKGGREWEEREYREILRGRKGLLRGKERVVLGGKGRKEGG